MEPRGQGREAVGPSDCALAVAVPLTLAEFERGFADPSKEYVRRVALPLIGCVDPHAGWVASYAEFAGFVHTVIDEVRERGVTVVVGARMPHVRKLLESHAVVTIVAHAPLRTMSPGDVADPSALLGRWNLGHEGDASNPVLRELRADPELRPPASVARLLRAVNRRIMEAGEYYKKGTRSGAGRARAILTPLHFYEAFDPALRPPPVIELADGTHGFEALVEAIPPTFDGTLDFLACSALWFLEHLRRRRPCCGDLLGPKQAAWFSERLLLYKHVIRQLEASRSSYREAALAIHAIARDWGRRTASAGHPALPPPKEASSNGR